jgi:hypothetical protein
LVHTSFCKLALIFGGKVDSGTVLLLVEKCTPLIDCSELVPRWGIEEAAPVVILTSSFRPRRTGGLHEFVPPVIAQVQFLAIVKQGVIVIMGWVLQIFIRCLGNLSRHGDTFGVSNKLSGRRK